MRILDWIKEIFRRSTVKKLEEPKEVKNSWKQSIHYEPDTEKIKEPLTEEQMRSAQINATDTIVLLKEGHLSREDIENKIHKKYANVVLDALDIQSLIAIHDVVEYEDDRAENNIREFIEEEDGNFVELVDKLEEFASKEAERHGSEDVSQFVPTDVETVDRLKSELEEERQKQEKQESEKLVTDDDIEQEIDNI